MGGKVGIWSKYFLYLLLLVGILILLYLHFRLSITRYFDADEFAHLHWGYAFSIGEKPYSDFFYLFPPFFLFYIYKLLKYLRYLRADCKKNERDTCCPFCRIYLCFSSHASG